MSRANERRAADRRAADERVIENVTYLKNAKAIQAGGQAVPALYFPVPARKRYAIYDTYLRIYIPGTSRKYARGHHYGIDIPGPVGTAICPAVAGYVRNPHWGSAYGNQAIVCTPGGGGLFFGHFRYACPYVGKSVTRTHTFAQMDTTGQVTGSHTHIEWHPVWYDWWSVANPYPRLEAARRAMLATAGQTTVKKAQMESHLEFEDAADGPTKADVDAMLEENHDWFDKADPWHREHVKELRKKARAA